MQNDTGSKQQNQGQNKFLDAALWYLKRGYSVIPCKPRTKEAKLLDSWDQYKKRLPTMEELQEWGKKWPNANVAIVLGEVSGIDVLDVDDEEAIKGYPIPTTPQVISGSGKPHYYFRHVKGMRNYKRPDGNGGEVFSIRGNGEIIVAPGSIHPNGKPYRWAEGLRIDQVEVADPPEWMLELVLLNDEEEEAASFYRKRDSERADGLREYIEGLKERINFSDLVESEGVKLTESNKRHDHFDNPWGESKGKKCFTVWKDTNVATHWHEDKGKRSYDIIRFIQKRRNIEFKEAINHLADYAKIKRFDFDSLKQPKKASQADLLVRLIEKLPITLFHDEYGEPCARFKTGHYFEIWKIRSKFFRRWICQEFWNAEKRALSSDAIGAALNIIEARACFSSDQHKLHNRVAWYEGAIWYDLGDWRAVRITKDGCEIVNEPPILFRRYSHQKVQATPEKAEPKDVAKIFGFINMVDEEHRLLYIANLICGLVPDIPHPIDVLHGGEGAAKTTTSAVKKELIDPSQIKTLSPPKDNDAFIQTADHHWFYPLDNLSGLSDWLSDAMCRAVTGEGSSKRELYTDDEDKVYSFKRCLSLTGINLVPANPDILSRSLIFELVQIPPDKQADEIKFWKDFDEAKPRLLGALFSLLSKAMGEYDNLRLKRKPRMADFATWGCAVARALGKKDQEFLNAYYNNIGLQNEEALEASPIARAIMHFMDDKESWKGSPSDLFTELNKVAEELKLDTKANRYPKEPKWLWRRINEIKKNLQAAGIEATRHRYDNAAHCRPISLTHIDQNGEEPEDPEGGDVDSNDNSTQKSTESTQWGNDDYRNHSESFNEFGEKSTNQHNQHNNNSLGKDKKKDYKDIETKDSPTKHVQNDDYEELLISTNKDNGLEQSTTNKVLISDEYNDDFTHSDTCDCETCIPKNGGNGSFELIGKPKMVGVKTVQKARSKSGAFIFGVTEPQSNGVSRMRWVYPSDRDYKEIEGEYGGVQ